MNEEVSQKTVQFAVNTGKVTGRVLWRCLKAYLRHRQNKKLTAGKGKQTVKQLIKQGQGASSMEVSGESIRTFKRIANKYGVDFAITKEKGSNPPVYNVFFKARDVDAIRSVVKDCTNLLKKKENQKESVIKKLDKYKEIVKNTPRKVKEKWKEQTR